MSVIRKAKKEDVPSILYLIKSLAEYEKEPDSVKNTEEQLQKDGFGENPLFECFLADVDGKDVGFALYFYTYSTWVGKCLYLEDIYVIPEMR